MELKLSDSEKELLSISTMETVVNSEHFNSTEKECLEGIHNRMSEMVLKLSDLDEELLGLSIMENVVNSEHYNSTEKECLEGIYNRMTDLHHTTKKSQEEEPK